MYGLTLLIRGAYLVTGQFENFIESAYGYNHLLAMQHPRRYQQKRQKTGIKHYLQHKRDHPFGHLREKRKLWRSRYGRDNIKSAW